MSRIQRKAVILIVDGLGDSPVPGLDHMTPLEAASTPILDRLAGMGRFGLVDPIAAGVVPNTHSGAGMLMGIAPGDEGLLRRGPVEAAGRGVSLAPGEVAMRANLATVETRDGQVSILDRRAGRIDEDTAGLLQGLGSVDLGDGITARLEATDQHRAVLVLSGPDLSAAVCATDPGIDSGQTGDPVPLPHCTAKEPGDSAAKHTAEALNRFLNIARSHLESHPLNRRRRAEGLVPANALLLRGAGSVIHPNSQISAYGLSAAVVAGCNTVLGLGTLLGYTAITRPEFTAGLDTDVDGKVRVAIEALEGHDLVYMHFKAPDLCAHDRDPDAKRDMLARLDRALEPLLDVEAVVAVAADHSTDSNTGLHTADPVPGLIAITGEGSHRDATPFGETSCASGPMGRIHSRDFLELVREFMLLRAN